MATACDRHVYLAKALAEAEKFKLAAEHYRSAYKIKPHSIATLNGLGILHGMQQQFTEAAHFFKAAHKIEPQNQGTELNYRRALDEARAERRAAGSRKQKPRKKIAAR